MSARRSVSLRGAAFALFLLTASGTQFGAASARQPGQPQQPQQGSKSATPAPATDAATKTPAPAKPAPAAAGPVVQTFDPEKPVIVHTDLITLTVTVTDTYGRFVTGLGKNAFTITDEKVPQEITFFSDEDAPVSLGVIFDVSGSMSGDKITRAREALRRFIETSHLRDEYFLIGFNNRAQLLLDRTRDSDSLRRS